MSKGTGGASFSPRMQERPQRLPAFSGVFRGTGGGRVAARRRLRLEGRPGALEGLTRARVTVARW